MSKDTETHLGRRRRRVNGTSSANPEMFRMCGVGGKGELLEGSSSFEAEGGGGSLAYGLEGKLNGGLEGRVVNGLEGRVVNGLEGRVAYGLEGRVVNGLEGRVAYGLEGRVAYGLEGRVTRGRRVDVDGEKEGGGHERRQLAGKRVDGAGGVGVEERVEKGCVRLCARRADDFEEEIEGTQGALRVTEGGGGNEEVQAEMEGKTFVGDLLAEKEHHAVGGLVVHCARHKRYDQWEDEIRTFFDDADIPDFGHVLSHHGTQVQLNEHAITNLAPHTTQAEGAVRHLPILLHELHGARRVRHSPVGIHANTLRLHTKRRRVLEGAVIPIVPTARVVAAGIALLHITCHDSSHPVAEPEQSTPIATILAVG